MGLTLSKHEGIYEPVVACDFCRQRIHDAGWGMVVLKDSGPTFLHKGDCDHRAGIKGEPWAELADFIERLAGSVRAR